MAPRKPPPAPPRPNPLKNRKPIIAPPPPIHRQALNAAAVQAAARPPKRACPNKTCTDPNVIDGICHSCGFIVDDSNIVSEVQFGEGSNGAAVVQGSFVSADQGTAKSLGPAFRRAGGMEDRESTVREGRRIMQALGSQLEITESIIASGVQIFKIAAMNNFIQGRRMDMVVAVCLYSACRKERPCKVMLIDFADKVQVNVFKLGHTFKALHSEVTLAKEGIQPVLPEDLIWRFALKLEFGDYLNKVAEDAVRLVQRMSLDWMVMGRRPSGVCGACLILAARMNNFRRSITEVVYVVKVTTHTIQKRLDEFKMTPSSTLSVEDFLNNEFLESSHDPPSFYEKSAEFQKNRKRRKRKRALSPEEDEENSGSEAGDDSNKRQKATTPGPEPELRRDAEGFAIPPQPTPQPVPQQIQSRDFAIDPALIDSAIDDQSGDTEIEEQSGMSFNKLIQQFGDGPLPEEDDSLPTSPRPLRKGPKPNQGIRVPEEWSMAEDEMSAEIEEMISDPNTIHHAASYAEAKKRAAAHMIIAAQTNPPKFVSMDVHVGEDEFADDPEVLNCVLPPAEVAKKEKVWVNDNKSWLRKQQIKEWQKRQAENGPPKAKRNRKKKPRIGEGQTSAASSPAEAALNVMKQRSFSKKINYDAIKDMFKDTERMGSRLGSATTSRVTSRAGSDFNGSIAGSEAGDDESGITGSEPATPRPTIPQITRDDDDEDGDEDDYVSPAPAGTERRAPAVAEEEEEEDWRVNVANRGADNDDEDAALDRLDRMDEDVSDYGSVDAGGLGDDVSVGGYGGREDEDSGEDE